MSRFADVSVGPPIEVFALTKAYNEDKSPNKVNLGVGAYRTEAGQPWVLPVVREAEKILAADQTLNHEYLPVLGIEALTKAATKMMLGGDSPAILENRVVGVQTLSGTGSLRVGAEFLSRILKYKVAYYSNPSWENHKLVFNNGGFSDVREYRYWSKSKKGLNIDGMLEDLRNAPDNSVVILHACAHNPTGCDPTREEWEKIADVMQEKQLFPFFDSAYQGFASGDLDNDAWAVRYFVSRGFELLCAQSFAKNFGLYGERVGNLIFVMKDQNLVQPVVSQVTLIIRGMYSNPPSHGARIVSMVLNDERMFEQWKEHIKTMSSRIIEMRKALFKALTDLNTPGNWDHIISQIGMFSYTGLTVRQSEHMVQQYNVYMLKSGRISMAGLNPKNVEYVAKAICETLNTIKE